MNRAPLEIYLESGREWCERGWDRVTPAFRSGVPCDYIKGSHVMGGASFEPPQKLPLDLLTF